MSEPVHPIVSPSLRSTLIVLPCSASKVQGGHDGGGNAIVDDLPARLAGDLRSSRSRIAAAAGISGPTMPAWRRYDGWLYKAGGSALGALVVAQFHVLILSGGYGVVRGDEPISWYDMPFELKSWPERIVQSCLQAYVRRHRLSSVRALMGASTAYARVVRSTKWAESGAEDSLMIAPDFHEGGAMAAVPTAIGEALGALVAGELARDWTTSRGVRFRWDSLT